MKRLEEKVAVVTGGNSGIGLPTAKRLQQAAAKAANSGRSKKTLEEAVKTIGHGVLTIQEEVGEARRLDKLCAEVSKKLRRFDVLLVNAGIARKVPLAEASEGVRHQHSTSAGLFEW